MSLLFSNFVISNAVAKITASTHFWSMYLICICYCEYNIQQVDILISKNKALQMLYLKHQVYKLHKLSLIRN